MITPVSRKSIAMRPVDFYGNVLPRPRFFDSPRVDPLLSWAGDAHWSTGGVNSTRIRLQGRIEGDVDELRAQQPESSSPRDSDEKKNKKKRRSGCDSPPPAAPVAVVKRRRYFDLNDDEGVARIIRNLSDDFDRVGGESKIIESAGKRLKVEKKNVKVKGTSSTRMTSPRLTKPLCFR